MNDLSAWGDAECIPGKVSGVWLVDGARDAVPAGLGKADDRIAAKEIASDI